MMSIESFLIVSAVNLVIVIVSHLLAKPWFDKRVNRSLQQVPPAPTKP